jgi:predicted phosphoribosyltransferase
VRCLEAPGWLGAIGQFYLDFAQIDDDQVIALLHDQAPPAGITPP